MRSNKGITLISLIASILLIIILAATTVVTSMNAYNQMKFEGEKAEIEEMQKLVNEIAADYQTYLKETGDTLKTYSDYFNSRYNVTADSEKFDKKLLYIREGIDISALRKEKNEIDTAIKNSSSTTFYFSSDDLVKYFELKGINPVVVEFSTRTVYSVNGIKDSSDKSIIYYTPIDWGSNTNVTYTGFSKKAYVEATNVSDSTKDVELVLWSDSETPKSFKSTNIITEVYYYDTTAKKYVKIDDFRDISNNNQTIIRVTVESGKTYKFRVVDELKNIYDTKVDLTR